MTFVAVCVLHNLIALFSILLLNPRMTSIHPSPDSVPLLSAHIPGETVWPDLRPIGRRCEDSFEVCGSPIVQNDCKR